jgi:hypothetical protein
MLRVRRRLELLDLSAPYPQLLPDPPDPADTCFHAMFDEIGLEPLGSKGLTGPFVGGPDLYLQSCFLPGMS